MILQQKYLKNTPKVWSAASYFLINHLSPQVKLISFLLTAPFQLFNLVLLLQMLCLLVRRKMPESISSGFTQSSPITSTNYQQWAVFSWKVNQHNRHNNSLQRFRSSLSSVHKAINYTSAFSTMRILVVTALVELRLPSVSAPKIYLLEVMQHLHFLSSLLWQCMVTERKGVEMGNKHFTIASRTQLPFKNKPNLEFTSKICLNW